MIVSYRTAALPLLDGPQGMASKLATGFESSKQGCFLWATCPILREFSEDREHVDEQTIAAIYAFFEQQARTTLRIMSSLPPADVPDVIEDFYRLVIDAL
jgi:transportin-3